MSGFSIPNPSRAMVNVNEVYIEHGSIHIIRVSPNQKFRASLHGLPLLLTARTEPYVFNDPTFRPAEATADASFVTVTDKYITNVIVHEIRLDQGEVSLAWLDNKWVLTGRAVACVRAMQSGV